MKFTNLSVSDVSKLTKLGFDCNDERCIYESGSLVNWTRVIITPAFEHCSLAHDENYMPCVRVKYETYQEPGYAECDWSHKSEGYVVIADLFEYLKSKGIYEMPSKEERLQAHRERQAIWAKIEAAGITKEELKKIGLK